jgi:hypothetical protein
MALFKYVLNLNNKICTEIFNHLIHNNFKKNSKRFIREIDSICNSLEINKLNLITDIQSIITKFKKMTICTLNKILKTS